MKGLTLNGVTLNTRQKDARAAVYCEDVDGLRIVNTRAAVDPEAEAAILLRNVRRAKIRDSPAAKET